jgi:hypothetical protein
MVLFLPKQALPQLPLLSGLQICIGLAWLVLFYFKKN